MRISRSHAYAVISAFCEEMPSISKWWPMPGDEEIIKNPKQDTTKVSAKEFIGAFGAAFRNK